MRCLTASFRAYGRGMGLTYSSVVDAPRDEVFAWHTRPGAFNRLSPPWSAMRLVSEATSLRDGRATLALPGGLRWVAQHQADSYDPPRRFVDATQQRRTRLTAGTHRGALAAHSRFRGRR